MNFVLLGFLRMIIDTLFIEEVEEIRDLYSCIFFLLFRLYLNCFLKALMYDQVTKIEKYVFLYII